MKLTSVAMAVLLLLVTTLAAKAAIIVTDLGTGAPPGTLGPYTMTAFPDDARPNFNNVNDVPSPLSGVLGFSAPLLHIEVGGGWATWSHGYTGDVYYSNGATSVTLTLPTGTGAFLFYAQPNPFGEYLITATANDGSSLAIPVNGNAGANGFGFHTTGGSLLTSITITSTEDFAIGEFAIAEVPEPATMLSWGAIAGVGAVVGAWRRRKAMKK